MVTLKKQIIKADHLLAAQILNMLLLTLPHHKALLPLLQKCKAMTHIALSPMSSFYCFKESRRTEAFIESPVEVKVFSDRLGGCHVAADQFFSSSKVKLID